MSILYWIIILGNLNTLGQVLLAVLLIVAASTGIFGVTNSQDDKCEDEVKKALKIAKKCLLYSIIPLLMVTFIPSTKQLYAIYGVGTVIDYAKESKEVQKLPNNAVKALNIWLENVNKDKKDSTNITK